MLPRLTLRFAAALLTVAGSAAAAETNSLTALEALVRDWSRVRAQLAAESRAAAEERNYLDREIDLAARAVSNLETQVAELESRRQTQDAALQTARAQQAEGASATAGLGAACAAAHQSLQAWTTWLPATPDAWAAPLPAAPAAALQHVLDRYAQLAREQNAWTVAERVIADDAGQAREASVLHLGLAVAFAVSPDDRWAAIGTPVDTGWRWTPRPELAADIRRAIRAYRGGRDTRLGALPCRLGDPAP